MTMLCQVTPETSCEAVKVKLISILGYIGKMAARKDNTLDILKVCFRSISYLFGGSPEFLSSCSHVRCIARRFDCLLQVLSGGEVGCDCALQRN